MTGRMLSSVKHVFLIGTCILSLYPVWFMVQTAFKTNNQYSLNPVGLPIPPTAAAFGQIVHGMPIVQWLVNSAIASIASAVVCIVIALFAGYALVFSDMAARRLLVSINLALMVVPPVTLLSPLFEIMVDWHLVNHLASVIVVYTGLFLPFSIFFLVNFLRTIPGEIVEAAEVDGLSPFGTLRVIVVPLVTPALFTLVLVNIIYAWNELLIALVFLQSDSSRTLMAGLAVFQGRYTAQQPLVMAGALLAVAPIVLLYTFGQRFFIRGLTAGIGR